MGLKERRVSPGGKNLLLRQQKGDTPMSIEKVPLSSLMAQAWEQLRGTVLEEVKCQRALKNVEI